MVEGIARILSRRLLRTERAAAFFRLLYLPALIGLALSLRPPGEWGPMAGLQGLAVVGLAGGYSIYVLVASAHGCFPARLSHLSAVLDAAAAAVLLYRLLDLPASIGSQAAVAAGEAYFFVPLIMSILKLRPLDTIVAALAAAIGSALAAAFSFLFRGGDGGIGKAATLSWLLLVAGLGCALIARSLYRLLEQNSVTDRFLRATRRLRMTLEIVQVSILNLSQWVNDLEKISGALALGAHSQSGSVERIGSLAGRMRSALEALNEATGSVCSTIKNTLNVCALGRRTVKRLLDRIAALGEAERQTVESLELLKEASDHTNLLALNAAIEASKTEQPGANSSAAAQQIRSLAESSSEAVGELSRLASQSSKAVLESADASREAAGVLDRIHAELSGFDEFLNELKRTVAEQIGAGEEVGASLGKIRDVAGENSLAAERVKQAMAALKNEVFKLKALLEDKLVEASEPQAASSAPAQQKP